MQTLTADASGSAIAKITWPSSAHTDQMPFAAIGETTHLVAKGTHPVDPTLLTTTTDEIDADGNAGDTVLFNGKDFAAVEKVTIAFNGKVISTTTSRKDGSFVASVVIPPLENVVAAQVQYKWKLLVSQRPCCGAESVSCNLLLSTNSDNNTYSWTLRNNHITGTHFPAGATIPIGWDGPFSQIPTYRSIPLERMLLPMPIKMAVLRRLFRRIDLVSGQYLPCYGFELPWWPNSFDDSYFCCSIMVGW